MGFVVDIIIILIIAGSLFFGYRKGLIGQIFDIISFIAAFLIAFLLAGPVAGLIMENTTLDDGIKEAIIVNVEGLDLSQTEEGNMIAEFINSTINDAKNNTAEAISGELTSLIIRVLSFVGLFILAKIVLFFFKAIANLFAELPIIKQFNKGGGIIVGGLKGFLTVFFVLGLMLLAEPLFPTASVYQMISESMLGNILYENNIIIKLFF